MRKHLDRYFIRYSFWAVLGLIGLSWGYILKRPTHRTERTVSSGKLGLSHGIFSWNGWHR